MSYYDIKNRWLSVGTPHKSRKSVSPVLARETVGEKGMGHFASMMLGDKLVITSKPWKYTGRGRSNPEEELKHIDKTIILRQDWKMYKDGEDFVKIPNEVEIIPRDLPNDSISVISTDSIFWANSSKSSPVLIMYLKE